MQVREMWVEKYVDKPDQWERYTNSVQAGGHVHVAGPGTFRLMVLLADGTAAIGSETWDLEEHQETIVSSSVPTEPASPGKELRPLPAALARLLESDGYREAHILAELARFVEMALKADQHGGQVIMQYVPELNPPIEVRYTAPAGKGPH